MAQRTVLVDGSSQEVGGSAIPLSTVIRNSSGTEMGTAANPLIVNSNQRVVSKSITYVTGTTGAVGATTLFTVTGAVLVRVFGVCTTALEEAAPTATIEAGVAGSTASIIAQTTASAIIANEIWLDASPTTIVEPIPSQFIIGNGQDIIQTIGAQAVSAGVLIYYCVWEPISSGATVVAA